MTKGVNYSMFTPRMPSSVTKLSGSFVADEDLCGQNKSLNSSSVSHFVVEQGAIPWKCMARECTKMTCTMIMMLHVITVILSEIYSPIHSAHGACLTNDKCFNGRASTMAL